MLPGFRFLFAAIVLSMSVLIFGLGAAALLRAAHEQFAHMPSRRAPPEPVFARQNEAPMPTLALLRVEPEVAEKVPDNVIPATVTLAPETVRSAPETVRSAPESVTPAMQVPAAEPEKLAAFEVEEPAPAEPIKSEIPAAAATPALQAPPAETRIANAEVKLAAIAETPTPPASAAASAVTEAPSLEANIAALKIATLGGPAVTIEQTVLAKPADAKPSRSSINRKRAQRAKERQRIAARRAALLARRAAAQQQIDPFAATPVARGKQ